MDCNREDAIRAREIAERKFATKDIAGAKKYALKAQNLFPSLEGINQMIATLDVYLASETRFNGESDLYSILAVHSSADEEKIKKQYRKLALLLHPDKNKSVGAEGAFKLVSEAWGVLSDKNRKAVYDQRIRDVMRMFQTKSKNNVFHTFANSARKSQKPQPKLNTFWTSCSRCKMQYEYLRVYLNHNLLCPNCHETFLAAETGFPVSGSSSNFAQKRSNHHQHNQHKNVNLDAYNDAEFHWGPFSRTAGAASANASSSVAAQAASVVQQTYEKVRREREEAQRAAKREEALRRRNSRCYNASDRHAKRRRSIPDETFEASTVERASGFVGEASRIIRLSRLMPQIDKTSLLVRKSKEELRKKLEQAKKRPNHDCLEETSDPKKATNPTSIVVQDSEFHNFDDNRLERSFEEDHVWATYDNEDGMPRFYVLIQKVISKKPFKLRMSFLNSKSNTELGPMNWVGSGFAKTCGDFRIGRYQVTDTLNIFSHRVQHVKGARGVIRIVPKVGETWALYRNWNSDWNELTPDEVIYKYDVVEVVEDFDEERGVLVTPMVKVAGFRAVFHRHLDPNEVKRIRREEMFRFSHQVPSYLLTGEEGQNAPKGCRELDPAAVPSDLLQVITEFKDEIS